MQTLLATQSTRPVALALFLDQRTARLPSPAATIADDLRGEVLDLLQACARAAQDVYRAASDVASHPSPLSLLPAARLQLARAIRRMQRARRGGDDGVR